jgi:hypothetical protein
LDTALGTDARLRVGLTAALGTVAAGARASLLRDGERVLEDWPVVGEADHQLSLARLPEPEPAVRVHRIHQRRDAESLDDFLNRWFHDRTVASNGEDGDMEDLRAVLPPRACLVQPPGGGTAFRWALAQAVAGRQSASFVGWSRALGDPWRGRFFSPFAADANWSVRLNPERWRRCRARGAPPPTAEDGHDRAPDDSPTWPGDPRRQCQWFEASLSLTEAELTDLVEALPNQQRHTLADRDEIPLLPATVRLGDRWLFCVAVGLRLDCGPDGGPQHHAVRVALASARPQPQPPGPTPGVVRVLAGFSQWANDGRSIEVLPATPAQVEAAGVPGFPAWEVAAEAGQSKPLLAHLLSPGYVREHYSWQYARLEPNDLLVVQIADGEPPIALGALQARRAEFEDATNATNALSGSAILIRTVDADGKPAGTELRVKHDGTASVAAKSRLSLLDNALITNDAAEFARDVTIKNHLDVG